MNKDQWENDKVLKLIKEYQKHEILWKKDNKFYYNVIKKEDAWREISQVMEESIGVVKKKIESLRGSRRREKARMMKSSVTGTGRDELYVSKWFAWESMRFLEDPEEIRPTIDNSSATENEESSAAEYEESDPDDPGYPVNQNRENNVSAPQNGEAQQGVAEENNTNTSISHTGNASQAPKKFKSPKKVAPRRRSSEDPRVQEAYDILKCKVRGEKKDESAMFGEYIAEKMRKLDNRKRALLQHRIHTLIFETEMAIPTLETSQQQVEPPISSHTSSRFQSPLLPLSHTSSPLQSPLSLSSHHTSSPLPSPLPPLSHTSSPLQSPLSLSSHHTSSPLPSPLSPSAHTTSSLHPEVVSTPTTQLLTLTIPESPFDIRGYFSSYSNADNV